MIDHEEYLSEYYKSEILPQYKIPDSDEIIVEINENDTDSNMETYLIDQHMEDYNDDGFNDIMIEYIGIRNSNNYLYTISCFLSKNDGLLNNPIRLNSISRGYSDDNETTEPYVDESVYSNIIIKNDIGQLYRADLHTDSFQTDFEICTFEEKSMEESVIKFERLLLTDDDETTVIYDCSNGENDEERLYWGNPGKDKTSKTYYNALYDVESNAINEINKRLHEKNSFSQINAHSYGTDDFITFGNSVVYRFDMKQRIEIAADKNTNAYSGTMVFSFNRTEKD